MFSCFVWFYQRCSQGSHSEQRGTSWTGKGSFNSSLQKPSYGPKNGVSFQVYTGRHLWSSPYFLIHPPLRTSPDFSRCKSKEPFPKTYHNSLGVYQLVEDLGKDGSNIVKNWYRHVERDRFIIYNNLGNVDLLDYTFKIKVAEKT